MIVSKLFAATVLATGLLASACQAAVFDFAFVPAFGSLEANGTLTTDSLDLFASVIDVTGTVNGVAIQGVAPGINLFHTTQFATVFSFFDVNGESYDIASFTPPLAFASSSTASATGTLTITPEAVSAVPLPASAPLFGAALLALGAVGYGATRKKVAAAA